MPCRDYYDDNPGAYAAQLKQENETKLKEQKRRLDTFARHLCFLCVQVEKIYGDTIWEDFKAMPKTEEHHNSAEELHVWWIQHQKDDAKEAALKAAAENARLKEIERKKARVEALKKLTAEEQKLLGL